MIVMVVAFPLLGFGLFTAYENYKDPRANARSLLDEDQKNLQLLKVGFQNQYGESVAIEDMTGNIYVANFFFATCPVICPKMNNQVKRVQDEFIGEENIKFLSFTVNPEEDSVAVLQQYAQNFGVQKDKWHLLTGHKSSIYLIARNIFRVAAIARGKNIEDDFIHSELLTLMDEEQRVIGYYEGTSASEVDRLIKDIKTLKKL